MTKHVKFGGSTAARTLGCQAWQELSDELPRSPTSHPAELGTALHEVIEDCLNDIDVDPYDFVGKEINHILLTEDNITDKIYPALDAFEELMDKYGIEKYNCESYYEMNGDAEIGGTTDYVGFPADPDTLVFADYKSGDGLMVQAANNKQNLFYAMCAVSANPDYQKYKKFVFAIVQPSERRPDTLDVWETDKATLDAFTRDHEEAVYLSRKGGQTPTAGDHCKFCPAEATCPAKQQLIEVMDGYEVDKIKLEQVADALLLADEIENWVKAVRKFAHESLERGQPIEGFKLVAKRATRKWTDEKAVEVALKAVKVTKAKSHDIKLKSPAQLEKIVPKAKLEKINFNELITKMSTGSTLVRETDPRPSLAPSVGSKMLAELFQ